MNTMPRRLFILLKICLLTTIFFTLVGCNKEKEINSEYEFIFEGSSSEFSEGRTYHATIYGNKDEEQTFTLKINEFPMMEMYGEWIFVENKGYKLYFEDDAATLVYSSYNIETHSFSFKYNLNLGSGYGVAKVIFTSEDKAFAKNYDGEGLGMAPPIFSAKANYAISPNGFHRILESKLYCKEDGTFNIVEQSGRAVYTINREGKWSYDKSSNTYKLKFKDDFYKDDFIRNFDDDDTTKEYIHWRHPDLDNSGYLVDNAGFYYEIWNEDEGPRNITTDISTTYNEPTNTYTFLFTTACVTYLDWLATFTPEV